MNEPNRIYVPVNYDVDIVIKYSTLKGQTELQVRNRSKIQLTTLQIAMILSEHCANVLRNLFTGKENVKQLPQEQPTEKPNGGDSNAS